MLGNTIICDIDKREFGRINISLFTLSIFLYKNCVHFCMLSARDDSIQKEAFNLKANIPIPVLYIILYSVQAREAKITA